MKVKTVFLAVLVVLAGLVLASYAVAETAQVTNVNDIMRLLTAPITPEQISTDEDVVSFSKIKSHSKFGGVNGAYIRQIGPISNKALASKDSLQNYYDPWSFGKLIDISYRKVKYVYRENNTPYGIVEILPTGEEVMICSILTATWFDPTNDRDGTQVLATYLIYDEGDGVKVTVSIPGRPNWDDLLLSAGYADGVFYGIPAGSIITKSKTVYDGQGRKTYAIMKTWKFDKDGKLYGTEVVKESLTYNNRGDLVSERTTFEVDGKLSIVKWVNYTYGRDGKLRLKTENILDYNKEGVIEESSNAITVFDQEGREINYILSEYRNGVKHHSLKRTTIYGGGVEYKEEETWYKDDGTVNSKRTYEKSEHWLGYTPFVEGQVVIRTVTEKWTNEGDGWKSIRTETQEFSNTGLTRRCYTYESAGAYGRYVSSQEETWLRNSYPWEEAQRLIEYSYKSVSDNWDANGKHIYSYSSSLSEKYENGKIKSRKQVYDSKNAWQTGEFITINHSEYSEDYEYDAQGDLVELHSYRTEFSYWSGTTSITDSVTKMSYDFFENGEKKLSNKHTRTVYAYNGDLTNPNYISEEDETYTYTTVNGKVLVESRVYSMKQTDLRNNSGWEQRVEDSYLYDERGNMLAKSQLQQSMHFNNGEISVIYETRKEEAWSYDENNRIIFHSNVTYWNNDEMQSLEFTSYTYHENGILDTVVTHRENLYGGAPYYVSDEVIQYNAQGNLIYRSYEDTYGTSYLEERTYAEDGKTLLTRDIESHNYWRYDEFILVPMDKQMAAGSIYRLPYRPYYNNYSLHEEYRPDGKITYRAEKGDNSYEHWYGLEVADYMRYGGVSSFSNVEKWEYAENGTLTRYEQDYSRVYGWDWPIIYYNADGSVLKDSEPWICYPVPYPYPQTSINQKVVRDYDPQSGKLLREEYTISSDKWNSWYWDTLIIRYGGKGDQVLNIPESCTQLIDEISKFFLSNNYQGHTEQKMIVDYSVDGKISLKFSVGDGTQTLSAATGTVAYDKDGNITAIAFSYTGDRQEEWLAILEGLSQLYPLANIEIANKAEADIKNAENPDLAGTLAVTEKIANNRSQIPENVSINANLASASTQPNEVQKLQ